MEGSAPSQLHSIREATPATASYPEDERLEQGELFFFVQLFSDCLADGRECYHCVVIVMINNI